ncbi:hypothetical protein ACQ4PT_011392 [Festuca glaucescens]
MSSEEKNMLKVGLESLPEEKMHNVMQIVQKRNDSNPELLGDEIELDIEEMDIEAYTILEAVNGVVPTFLDNADVVESEIPEKATALAEQVDEYQRSGDIAEVGDTAGAEAVNGAVPTFVDNADVVNPKKTAVVAGQVDEYVDIEDEMPTSTYQSVEIKKGIEVVTVSGGSGSGSSSSSGSESGSSADSASEAVNAREPKFLHCFSFGFVYRFGVRELSGQRLRSRQCSFSAVEEVVLTVDLSSSNARMTVWDEVISLFSTN